MTPRPTTKNGKPCWTIDARGEGHGRIFAPSKQLVLEKYRRLIAGIDKVEFTDRDRHAKTEADQASVELLDALRYYLAHKPTGLKKPLSEAIAECVEAKRRLNMRKAYLNHLRHVLEQLNVWTGEINVAEINSQHIKTFLASKVYQPATLAGMKNRLSAFFAYALDEHWHAINPCDNIKTPKVEKSRPHILTVEQAQRLLDTAQCLEPSLLAYLALGLFCGIRPEELQRLPAEAIQIDQGIIDLPAHVSKTRDRRVVELSANARAWLRVAEEHTRPRVSLNAPRIQPPIPPFGTLRRRRRILCGLARVEWSPDVMRHTFASYHIAQHQSADKTAHELGHHGSTRMLFRHYKATVTKEDAAQFWALEPAICLKVMSKTGTHD